MFKVIACYILNLSVLTFASNLNLPPQQFPGVYPWLGQRPPPQYPGSYPRLGQRSPPQYPRLYPGPGQQPPSQYPGLHPELGKWPPPQYPPQEYQCSNEEVLSRVLNILLDSFSNNNQQFSHEGAILELIQHFLLKSNNRPEYHQINQILKSLTIAIKGLKIKKGDPHWNFPVYTRGGINSIIEQRRGITVTYPFPPNLKQRCQQTLLKIIYSALQAYQNVANNPLCSDNNYVFGNPGGLNNNQFDSSIISQLLYNLNVNNQHQNTNSQPPINYPQNPFSQVNPLHNLNGVKFESSQSNYLTNLPISPLNSQVYRTPNYLIQQNPSLDIFSNLQQTNVVPQAQKSSYVQNGLDQSLSFKSQQNLQNPNQNILGNVNLERSPLPKSRFWQHRYNSYKPKTHSTTRIEEKPIGYNPYSSLNVNKIQNPMARSSASSSASKITFIHSNDKPVNVENTKNNAQLLLNGFHTNAQTDLRDQNNDVLGVVAKVQGGQFDNVVSLPNSQNQVVLPDQLQNSVEPNAASASTSQVTFVQAKDKSSNAKNYGENAQLLLNELQKISRTHFSNLNSNPNNQHLGYSVNVSPNTYNYNQNVLTNQQTGNNAADLLYNSIAKSNPQNGVYYNINGVPANLGYGPQGNLYNIVSNGIADQSRNILKPEFINNPGLLQQVNTPSFQFYNKEKKVELIYRLQPPSPIRYVKSIIPLVDFLNSAYAFQRQRPFLRQNSENLLQQIASKAEVAEVSPNIDYSKEEIKKSISEGGKLLSAKIVDSNTKPSDYLNDIEESNESLGHNDGTADENKKEYQVQTLQNTFNRTDINATSI